MAENRLKLLENALMQLDGLEEYQDANGKNKFGIVLMGLNGTKAVPLQVDEDGVIASSATIETGDIEIGAVELKDADADVRANINAANTARTTGTKVIATQDIDAAGKVHNVGTGNMAASKPVTLATDDTQFGAVGADADVDGNVHGQLRSMAEALEIIDNMIATGGDTAATDGAQMLGLYLSTLVEVATGKASRLMTDAFQRLEIANHDRSTGTGLTTDLTSVSGVPFSPGDAATLTAAGSVVLGNVDGYLNHIVSVTIAAIDTDVSYHISGSIDGGTTYVNVAEGDAIETETANGTYLYKVTGPYTHLALVMDDETGGTAVTLTGRVRSSN